MTDISIYSLKKRNSFYLSLPTHPTFMIHCCVLAAFPTLVGYFLLPCSPVHSTPLHVHSSPSHAFFYFLIARSLPVTIPQTFSSWPIFFQWYFLSVHCSSACTVRSYFLSLDNTVCMYMWCGTDNKRLFSILFICEVDLFHYFYFLKVFVKDFC